MTKINMSYSEFDVQAAAYSRLKKRFRYVRGEVKIAAENGERGARLDIVICDKDGNIQLIFETKKRRHASKETKQIKRYREMFDCPVILLAGYKEACDAVDIALRALMPIDYRLLYPKK